MTPLDFVQRALRKGAKVHFASQGIWQLGSLRLTNYGGQPTSYGEAYLSLRPDASLAHFDRRSITHRGGQTTAVDAGGTLRTISFLRDDGKWVPTVSGRAAYNHNDLFRAKVSATLRSRNGQFSNTTFDLTDIILDQSVTGAKFLDELNQYARAGEDLELTGRRLRENLKKWLQAEAREYDLNGERRRYVHLNVYDRDFYLDPDMDVSTLSAQVFQRSANDPSADYNLTQLETDERGVPMMEDDLYRKTGLTPAAWRNEGNCMLIQFHEVNKFSHHNPENRPRFTLEELAVIFDEAWEADRDAGPREELVAQFRKFSDKLDAAELRGRSLEDCIRENRPMGLRDVTQRYYGWMEHGPEKTQKVWRLLHERPRSRECTDWREEGANVPLLERVCEITQNRLIVWKNNGVIHDVEPKSWETLTFEMRRNRPTIGMTVNNGHAFFYTDPAARSNLPQMRSKTKGMPYRNHVKLLPRKDEDFSDRRVPFEEMEVFDLDALEAAVKEGRDVVFRHYDTERLANELRAQTQLSFRENADLKGAGKLIFAAKKNASVRVRQVPDNAWLLQGVARRAQARGYAVEYYGENMAGFVASALEAMCMKRRGYLTKMEKRRVIETCGNACASCGAQSEKLEFDHVTPLSAGGTNDLSNFQPLCVQCHAEKTAQQGTRAHLLHSELSPRMLDLFLKATFKPKQASGSRIAEVFPDGVPWEEAMYPCLDVVGCRRNALLQLEPCKTMGRSIPRTLPLGCVTDEEEEVPPGEWRKFDFLHVEIPGADLTNPEVLESLKPYDGPKFYDVEVVEGMVDLGLFDPSILKTGVRFSRRQEPKEMDELYTELGEMFAEEYPSDAKILRKAVYLQHIGIMGIRERHTITVVNSTRPQDVPSEDVYQMHGVTSRLGFETTYLDNRTMYLWSIKCLQKEQLYMVIGFRMVREAEKALRRPLAFSWHVDGIGLREAPDSLRAAASKHTYANGAPIFQFKDEPFCRYMLGAETLEARFCDKVPAPPRRETVDEREFGDGAGLMQRLAERLHDNGGGWVAGPGGVGKTHLIREFKALTERLGEICHVVALTHVAARLAQGMTLQLFLHRYATMQRTSSTWIVVDEASQIPLQQWADLTRFQLVGCRFLIVGDFEGQLRPICDLWPDARRRFEDAEVIWTLANGLRLNLTRYRRGFSKPFFDWYCAMYAQVPKDDAGDHSFLREMVLEARANHPWESVKADDRTVHVVMSHAKRVLINELCNQQRKDSVWIPGDAPFWCHVGMVLQSRKTMKSLNLLKFVLYRVQAIDETDVILQTHEDYGKSENFSIPRAQAAELLQLSYAVVYFCVQGRTIRNQRVVLWDTLRANDQLHQHMTLRHFIMAVQRVEDPKFLSIASPEQERIFLHGFKRGLKRGRT